MGTERLIRPRVYRQLDQIFSRPLTVLCAPAGFGKTEALRGYVRDRGLRPIWLSVLGADASPECCWARLTALMRGRNDVLADRLDCLGFPGDAPSRARAVALIAAAEFASPTLVVVDDYHLADCRLVAELVALIAATRIRNLHLLLLTREPPRFPPDKPDREDICRLPGQELLRLRAEEFGAFVSLYGCEADETMLRGLEQRTDGWIPGVYLALRAPRPAMETVAPRREALDAGLCGIYAPDTYALLLRLCLLDAFTPELAACALDDPSAAAEAESLCREGVFFSAHGRPPFWEMTGFLRQHLRERADELEIDPLPIWRRAGMWLLAHGDKLEAYGYLCRAGDGEPLLTDLDGAGERETARRLAQFPQLHALFEALPAETLRRYPMAALRWLRVRVLLLPTTGREVPEARLRELERYFLTADLPDALREHILGELYLALAYAAFNQVQPLAEYWQRAAEHPGETLPPAPPTLGAPHLLYCYYDKPGALRERAEFIAAHFSGPGEAAGPLALAEYALETGDFAAVESRVQAAANLARRSGQTGLVLCAALTQARLLLYYGRFEEGRRLLSTLAEQIAEEDNAILNTAGEISLAYVDSCYGRGEDIPLWLRDGSLDDGFVLRGAAFPYLVCLRAVLLSGAFVRLEVRCQELHGKFDTYHNVLGRIHSDICLSVARGRLYGIEAGCEALEKVLLLASGDGVVMPFAESAESLLPMLRKMRGARRVPQPFLERVTACCEAYQQSVSGRLADAVILTDREREIMLLLTYGMKHEEIASRLSISVPTVRYHVKNIYQKLEVNDKSSAIQKARSMKLIL